MKCRIGEFYEKLLTHIIFHFGWTLLMTTLCADLPIRVQECSRTCSVHKHLLLSLKPLHRVGNYVILHII